MKNLLLFIAIIFSTVSYSQDYIPMLQDGIFWNVTGLDGFGGPSSNVTREVTGEEIINGVTYKIVDNVDCRYREENGKVYAYYSNNDTEYLMYDFSMEVGDVMDFSEIRSTSCHYITDTYIDEMTVASKSTQFIAGEDRTVLELESFGSYIESWIEGIGSTTGFFPNGNGFDSASRLTCFTKDGVTYFFNGYTECIVLGLDDFSAEEIILFPNPVSNISIVRLPTETSVNRMIVYNMNGLVIKEEVISNDYFTINAMDYASGFYFYKVFSDSKVFRTSRFIVK